MKHKVKVHRWKHGRLEVNEFFFDELHEALHFLKKIDYEIAKIYNDIGEIVRELVLNRCPDSGESYA